MKTEIFFDAGLDSPNQIESVGEIRTSAHGFLGLFEVPTMSCFPNLAKTRAGISRSTVTNSARPQRVRISYKFSSGVAGKSGGGALSYLAQHGIPVGVRLWTFNE